jgi:hypothetical protein
MRNQALSIAVFLVLSVVPLGISGQEVAPPQLTPAQHALYIAVARFCANEAFGHTADCLLIWQTVRHHGDTPEARLAWLTEHSTCVLAPNDPPPTRRRVGNCPWTRYLNDSDEQPRNWPEGWTWAGYNTRVWAGTRDLVRGLVIGRRPRGGWPCPIDPDTWAGRRTDEQRIENLPPSMVPLRCTNPRNREVVTLNEGFRSMTPEQRARFEERFPPPPPPPLAERPFVDINPSQDVDRD